MPKKPPPRKDHNRVPRAPRALAPAEPREAERVAKVIARAGLGSRREIEEWIAAGRVAVNGTVLESPAFTVTAEDSITVDGEKLPQKERTRLFLYHKPKGVVTTNFDPEGRPTLFEILPPGLPRLVSVGRLDLNTEGLILLTNDGGLSRVLELPETGWLRRYRVRAKGSITQDRLDALIEGITVEGVHYGPIEAMLDRVQGANVWLTLALREGKNREVRNVLGSLGLDVNRLIRLSYGPFQLGEIPQGEIEEVRTRVLADQLGPELSAAAGADFEGPQFDHADGDEAPRRPRKAAYAKPEGGEDRHRRRPIDTEVGEGRSVSSGLLSDRKGRKVLVQRVRSTEPVAEERPSRPRRESERREEEREAARARPVREPKRGGGERTFRRRPDRAASPVEGEAAERPFREERRVRPERKPSRDRAGAGPRPSRPRFEERPLSGEKEGGERSFRPRAERPARSFEERGPRERPAGDRPFRERGERPDRPPRRERPEGARPYRGEASDRPYTGRVKSELHRERRPRFSEGEEGRREERPARPPRDFDRPRREDRLRREDGERPARRFDRPARSGEDRPPRRERPEGDRPFREKRSFGERGERPEGGKTYGAKSFGEKRSFGDKPRGKSFGDRPAGGKSFGGKPGGKSGGPRTGGKPGGRPTGGKPGGRPPRAPRG